MSMLQTLHANSCPMPTKQQKDAVLSRLRALFEAVSEEAIRSPDFFSKIEQILLSPEAVVSSQVKPVIGVKPPIINVLEILHREGESAARDSLDKLTNDDLAKLTVADGIKKLKEAKSMERESLIAFLLETASNRLKQGESFTKG